MPVEVTPIELDRAFKRYVQRHGGGYYNSDLGQDDGEPVADAQVDGEFNLPELCSLINEAHTRVDQ